VLPLGHQATNLGSRKLTFTLGAGNVDIVPKTQASHHIDARTALMAPLFAPAALAQAKKPNIIVIMGDDIGWFNVGAYHRGMMSGKTPNLDALASQGMLFTDYYAEASCTAGRANFIT
jgi:phosphoglycerol transferase MdoB-like AlkP superfamily enzyme